MVKLKDIAQKAKVSIATVSLALNDNTLVNIDTKERVKKWAEELNYFPNLNAQRLAKRKSFNICIFLNSKYFFKSPNIYYLKVIGGIIRESEHTDYTISFSFYGREKEDRVIIRKINTQNLDGIIIFDVINETTLKNLKNEFKVPIVLVDNHKKYNYMYSIDNDDFGGAYKATKYMLSLGHTKIGYIGIPDCHPLGNECWKGFKKALNEKGIKETVAYKNCEFSFFSGKKAINYLFSKDKNLPTGFFCVNDYIAIGAIEELRRKGYKVPDDFSFVAMDDMEISSEVEPPLTTVRIKMEELGASGLRKIISLINNNFNGEIKTIIDNDLIIRNSCRKFNI